MFDSDIVRLDPLCKRVVTLVRRALLPQCVVSKIISLAKLVSTMSPDFLRRRQYVENRVHEV